MKPAGKLAYLELVTAAIILSFSGPFARWAALPSGAMSFVRTAIPSVILASWLLIVRRSPGKISWLLVTASLLNALRILMFFEGYRLTTVGNAVIVLYTWPAFALLFGSLILREAFTVRDLLLVLLAFAGMVIVYSGAEMKFSDRDFLGMTVMLGSSAIYALTLVMIRKADVDRLAATLWQNLAGAVIFLPAFIRALGQFPTMSWFWASVNGLGVGTVGFILVFSAFRNLPAAVVGHISYLEVVFALVWGAVFFSEPVTWRLIVGGGLIVISMIIRAELVRRQNRLPGN